MSAKSHGFKKWLPRCLNLNATTASQSQRTCQAVSDACLHLSHLWLSISHSLNSCPFKLQSPVSSSNFILNWFLLRFKLICHSHLFRTSAENGLSYSIHISIWFCHLNNINLEIRHSCCPGQDFSSVSDSTYIIYSLQHHRFDLQHVHATDTFSHFKFVPEHAYSLFKKYVPNKAPWVQSQMRATQVSYVPETQNAGNQNKLDEANSQWLKVPEKTLEKLPVNFWELYHWYCNVKVNNTRLL